jgi:formylmethanofuran dehydrogenase subunit E
MTTGPASLTAAMQQLDTAERMLVMRDEVDEAQALDFIKLARDVHRLSAPKAWQQASKKDRKAILELAAKYILVMGRELLERRLKEQEARYKTSTAERARKAAEHGRCARCGEPLGDLAVILAEGRAHCTACAKVL